MILFHYFRQRLSSFGFAIEGLCFVLRTQPNARIHLVVAIFVLCLGFVFEIGRFEWMIISITITSVWVAETINTAFEYLCDVVSPQYLPAVKHAKDISAGAVLISASGALVIGILLFAPHLFWALGIRF